MKTVLVLSALFIGTWAFGKNNPHPANCSKIPASASACATICQSCAGANFLVGDVGIGTGFYADCAGPIIKNGGTHQPKKAKQALPAAPSGTWEQIGQQCASQGGMPKGL